ncbi:probable G-protein coupled receptor 45 [Xenia sp. Carnegie-2017]|uniref:probable G-protein coupled receptor 45 n=1 Tax=Xenia sp. Carnegie-2017 TaxID=2897299 RepID=UPI001F047695|nr:probable G-protein coupled receptor 45 [Xenia sp. Carnegie-2017]
MDSNFPTLRFMSFSEENITSWMNNWPIKHRLSVAIISFFGIFFNFLTLITFFCQCKKIFRKVHSVFAINLFISEIIINISSFVWVFLPYHKRPEHVHLTVQSFIWLGVSLATVALLMMVVERVCFVVFAKRMLEQGHNALLYCCFAWFFFLVYGMLMVDEVLVRYFTIVIIFYLCSFVLVICSMSVHRVTKQLEINEQRVTELNGEGIHDLTEVEQLDQAYRSHRRAVRRESRRTNTVLILVVIFLLTAFPYMILMLVVVLLEFACEGCGFNKSTNKVAKILFPIEMLNFAVTPLVYFWQMPKFRQKCVRNFVSFFNFGEHWH